MKTAITVCSLFISTCCFSQSLEEKLVASLDSFSTYNPQEKSYLQTDRTKLMGGETIWFKAYVTLYDKPTTLSKIVYVTLSNEMGVVLQKKQLKLVNGSAAGELELPADLKAGNYSLHAFTLWMMNFPDFMYAKNITVFDAKPTKNKKPVAMAENVKLQFFPEGGQMIAGLPGKLAFKCIDQLNRPVNISGTIKDSKGNTSAIFSSSHNGMGVVSFTPKSGETYAAIINENLPAKNFELPVVLQEGITLTANNSSASKIFVKLERGETNKDRFNNLLLVARQNYQVVYMAKINFDEGQDAVAINKKDLPAGILQVTVFSSEGIPLAARSVFVSNYNEPAIVSTAINNTKRAKNTLSINLDTYDHPDMGLSVLNVEAADTLSEQTILSGLLLSSDIKGYIHQPAYYFKNKNSNTLQGLDVLMMVHGFSRYNWTDVMAVNFPMLQYPFETSMSITGRVLQANGKSPLQAGKMNLIIKGEDSTTILSEATLNAHSDFIVSDIDFKKEATVYYQGNKLKNANALVSVKMNAAFIDSLQRLSFFAGNNDLKDSSILPPYIQTMIRNKYSKEEEAKTTLLEEVKVTAKKISASDSASRLYATPIFEQSDQTLIMDAGPYFDIWQYLQRKVPGIGINKTETGPEVNFSRYEGASFFSDDAPTSTVQFFLNEVPIPTDLVATINPEDVGIIKVFKGVLAFGLGADRGAIAIYTKKGVSTRDWRDKGFDFIKKMGYTVTREFYAMDYSILNPESSFSDVRPTLYWNPSVAIVDGKAIIEFYNDDVSKKSKLVLEGIDKKGRLIYIEKVLE